MSGALLEFRIFDLAVAVYVAGVLWGLLVSGARPLERLTLAVLWPLGPFAFAVTAAILLATLPIAFPKVGIPMWLVAGGLFWFSTR